MTSLHLQSRLRIAALALGVGCLVLYLSKTSYWVKWLDASFVMMAISHQEGEQFVYQLGADSNKITIGSLSKKQGQKNHPQTIQITDDPDKIFEQSPPSALDYAIILTSLHKRGFRDVIMATNLNWDQQVGIETQGLGRQLGLFDYSAISMPVTRVATPRPVPDILKRSLIPMVQVSGNPHQLPLINHAPIPVHADGGKHTLAGFSEVESMPAREGHIKLLAHWQGQGLIPSIELLTIMIAHKISPADIRVSCGDHIRLGKNGPIIPIDSFGQTPVPDKPAASLTPIAAEKLIAPVAGNKAALKLPDPAPIAIIHASGKKTAETNTISAGRLADLIALSHHYPIAENPTSYPRLPIWASLILLIDVALLSFWYGGLVRSIRKRAYIISALIIIPLLFALLAALLYLTRHWLSLSAPLATLLTVWILHVTRIKSPRLHEKPASDPAK
ncbi:MAG: hypothetical protein ACPIG6_09820 [Akkermansiaceae bacterium]